MLCVYERIVFLKTQISISVSAYKNQFIYIFYIKYVKHKQKKIQTFSSWSYKKTQQAFKEKM